MSKQTGLRRKQLAIAVSAAIPVMGGTVGDIVSAQELLQEQEAAGG